MRGVVVLSGVMLAGVMAGAQGTAPIVQPGAPGTANKSLTPETAKSVPRPPSKADVDFMQGMIMHHNQAVEMTELLKTRSKDPEVQELGHKIDVSQTDEMRWMKNWLTERGLPLMPHISHAEMESMDMDDEEMANMMPPMPGMLTKAQMDTLRKADGRRFDKLFLTGMMQHHTGALTMVKVLFQSPGAGQDPFLFDFANDVDNTQQAEIDIMRHILEKEFPEGPDKP